MLNVHANYNHKYILVTRIRLLNICELELVEKKVSLNQQMCGLLQQKLHILYIVNSCQYYFTT